MNPENTVGLEIELNLCNRRGYLTNRADQVLNDPRNDGFLVAEATKAMIEVNSNPAPTISLLHHDISHKLSLLEKIAQEYAVLPIAASEFGAGRGISRNERRYQAYQHIIGPRADFLINTIAGIHAHFSQDHDRRLDQFLALTALDCLSYALTSTSPLSYRGVNSLNCHRVNIVRRRAFTRFPYHSQLLPYPSSMEELERWNKIRYEQWQKASGLDPEEFSALFMVENTGYSPIRQRDSIGDHGTWEVRSFDTSPLPAALAAVAIYKGVNDRILNEGIPISISRDDAHYSFQAGKVVLPSYPLLRKLEQKAIASGLNDDEVVRYVRRVMAFAEKGLPLEDQKYLEAAERMLHSRINPAEQLMAYLHEKSLGNRYTPREVAQANLFLREEYLRGLEY